MLLNSECCHNWRRENILANLAERQGFEPWEGCPSTVFKTAAFDRSATSPTGQNTILTLLILQIIFLIICSALCNTPVRTKLLSLILKSVRKLGSPRYNGENFPVVVA